MSQVIYSSHYPGNNTPLAAVVNEYSRTTNSLANNASQLLDYSTTRYGILMAISSNRDCLVRVYTSHSARALDSRLAGDPVPTNGVPGLIAEVTIDPTIKQVVETSIVFANADSPPAERLYVKVYNTSGVTGSMELKLSVVEFLPQTVRDKMGLNLLVAAAMG
jgi:hypothetical protein